MKILEVYPKYLGMKEGKGNTFTDADILGKLLHAAGQKDGESWCCYMQEGLFKEAYPEHFQQLDKLFSANCQQTFKNFQAAGFEVTSLPKVGALCIWVKMLDGEETTKGHAGLVVELVDSWRFKSAEGNSNNEGSREGYEFDILPMRKTIHSITNGLKVKGFINIPKFYGDH